MRLDSFVWWLGLADGFFVCIFLCGLGLLFILLLLLLLLRALFESPVGVGPNKHRAYTCLFCSGPHAAVSPYLPQTAYRVARFEKGLVEYYWADCHYECVSVLGVLVDSGAILVSKYLIY